MKNHLRYIALVCLCMCVASCIRKNEKLTAEQINENFSSGVVLVQVASYFSIELDHGLTFYFSGIDDSGELTDIVTSVDSITPALMFGTGFFVDNKGTIITNNHVITPSVDEKKLKQKLRENFNHMVEARNYMIQVYVDSINALKRYYYECYDAGEQMDEAQVNGYISEWVNICNMYQQQIEEIKSVDISAIEVIPHANISIAYNDTYVKKESDLYECFEIKRDADHDLAAIQLKNKTTPEGKFIFDAMKHAEESENAPRDDQGEYVDVDKSKLGTKLYLIGYNLGPSLALTKEGIKAQITDGEISQNTDDVKMMYTIPALHGSSGSPVVDEYGNLICVNFAGIDTTQSFNYGIKVKWLRNLLGY